MVKVTITGPCASGKTTLARAFETFLREHGFDNVTVMDEDVVNALHPYDKLRAIANREIVIETVQTRRGT